MDISAPCFNQAPSSFILRTPFSDQSHIRFYRRTSFVPPSKLYFTSPCLSVHSRMSKSSSSPFRALADSVCDSVIEPSMEQALMKELADLKLQMKQKKKELKVRLKDDKRKLKIEMKEGKKMKKQKDVSEVKKKTKKCSADSSSSSSESSDGECESVSMKTLRQERIVIGDAKFNGEEGVCSPCKDGVIPVCGASSLHTSGLGSGVVESFTDEASRISDSGKSSADILLARASVGGSNEFRGQVDAQSHDSSTCGILSTCRKAVSSLSGSTSNGFPTVYATNRIEVCAGGKCKKAGSELLLSALRGQIPRALNAEVVPCKCMGKCSMAINVKVYKEDTNPQHHSHVGVGDANLILNHHFRSPSGLPSLSCSKEGMRAPWPLVGV